MPSVVVELRVLVDGEPIRTFPLARRQSVDELQTARYEKASGAGFVDLPVGELTTLQYLLIETDQAATFQFANATPGNITLAANGLLLLVNANLSATPEVENTSGNTAKLKIHAGGT